MIRRFMVAAGLSVWAGLANAASASDETVVLDAVLDNTLYEDFLGTTSNGSGQHIFSGTTNGGSPRRALLAFDVASAVPAGATVRSVELRLYMSQTIAGAESIAAHRVLASWGEGASDAPGGEGGGDIAQDGDATWVHRFHPDVDWATMGGDYDPAASATTVVANDGYYTWSGAGLVADVQAWVDAPLGDFGWVLINRETVVRTAKRFDSRENPASSRRPRLTIDYTLPVACPEDVVGSDGVVDIGDLLAVLAAWNTDGPGADITSPEDLVTITDLLALLTAWGPCP